jgi:hypothetical protein
MQAHVPDQIARRSVVSDKHCEDCVTASQVDVISGLFDGIGVTVRRDTNRISENFRPEF